MEKAASQKKQPIRKKIEETESEDEQEEEDLEVKIEKSMEKVMNKFKTSFKKELQKEFQGQLREIEKSLNFNSEKMEEILAEMVKVNEKQRKLEAENQELKTKLMTMSTIVEDLEQYTRNRNIQIDGMPEENNEDLRKMMKNIGEKIQVEFEDKEVDAIHRLPTRNESNNCPPIVVQFTTRQVRDKILTNARKTKLNTKDFGKTVDKPIFINEHLTKSKKQIMFEARRLKIARGYKFLWTRNGKVLIRKSEQTRVIELRTLDDLVKIV